MAQSAVSSLLGQLSSLLVDEAKLLGGVRRDVQFIKDEMESMQGFLLDADSAGDAKTSNSNQVMAWRRLVREVAYDSQKCIDLYVQTVGASRPSAGLLGSVCWLPQLLRTMPARHRIAVQINELKVRAREVGERRRRYGVKAPEGVASAGGGAAAGLLLLPQQRQEAEHARKRRAIADATDWVNTDAQHVMNWIAAGGGESKEKHTTVMDVFKKMAHIPHFTTDSLITELIALTGNRADATSFLKEHALEWAEWLKKDVLFLLKELLLSSEEDGGDHFISLVRGKFKAVFGDHGAKKKEPAAAAGTSSTKEEPPQDEDHQIISLRWLRQVLRSKGINIVHSKNKTHGPRFLAIVTPPVVIQNLEDEDHPHEHRRATEIAARVYDHYSSQGRRFDFTVWVNAEQHSKPTAMLKEILKQVKEQVPKEPIIPPSSSSSHDDVGGKTTNSTTIPTTVVSDNEATVSQHEIAKHLTGKKYLIFLANHPQDDTSWTEILSVLPTDSSDESSIILTPLVQQGYQYVGWFTLSLFFLIRHSRYRVYFYSHLVATKKKAKEFLQASKQQDIIDKILTTCRWDSVSTKMFLHALHANPHRSKDELERLHLCLNEFSTVSNAINMISFCYDDLPNHYKVCFVYLSIFPSESKIRRTSLVRRWAAEGLLVGRDGLAATDEAERCFNELVDRGLLLPADNTENPSGKVKICKVHPHVPSFITRMPRDDGHAAGDSILLPPALAHRLSIPSGIHLSKKTRRACEGMKKQMERDGEAGVVLDQPASNESKKKMDHDGKAGVLEQPASEGLDKQMDRDGEVGVLQQPSVENMVKLVSLFRTSESGWIKVLDLEGYHGLKKKHLKGICNKIFQLKYLSLRKTGIAELPKEINKLRDLETFDIRETNIEHFPAKSIVLPKLGQLLSGGGSSHGYPSHGFTAVDIPRRIGNMTNMQVLSHVRFCDAGEDAALDLVRLRMLRKLGVVINGKQGYLLLQVVGMLSECLMSLSIHISDIGEVPDLNNTPQIFSPPRSLTGLSISGKIGGLPRWLQNIDQLSDITLCETFLSESDISTLGALINLRFVRLLSDSYSIKRLNFEKGFRSLEFLIIQGSTISAICFGHKVAPKLEKIVWSSTCKMETLDIDGLQGLKEIELHGDYNRACIRGSIGKNPNNPVLKELNPSFQLRSSSIVTPAGRSHANRK